MEEKNTIKGIVWEIVKFLVLAAVIVLPIRTFVVQPFIVSGASMDPTFADGQYLIVDELSYHFGKPERGEVVILRYPRDPSKFFIKRVVGLPNETVEINSGTVTIKTNSNKIGFQLNEPYIEFTKKDNMSRTLAGNEYFVMGDNRSASSDSRSWGPVTEELIIGKAFLRLFPVANASVLPGDYEHI